jgi:predicted amidophosphoribosyltransferase
MKVEPYFHNENKVNYIACLKYYPTKFTVDKEYQLNRKVVYEFKDGKKNDQVDKLFVTIIDILKNKNPMKSYWLCPIPASKIISNNNRYNNFCERISNSAGISNGFSMIKPIKDRDQVHIGAERNYSEILESIQFSSISGKDIILIDDVITVGRSFKMISNHLYNLGAKSVYGILLAKTNWIETVQNITTESEDLPF